MKQQSREDGKPRAAAGVVLMMILMPAANAAERIEWEDLQKRHGGDPTCNNSNPAQCRFGLVEYRSITVITRGGKKLHTRRLMIDTNGVRMAVRHDKQIAVPRSEVTRIEIRPRWRYVHNLVFPTLLPLVVAALSCGDSPRCNPLRPITTLVMFSPVWAYPAVTTPFFLAAEGVGFFLPATVYEIEGGGEPGVG